MVRALSRRWIVWFSLAALLVAAAQTAGALSFGALSDKRLAFTITRNGDAIGSHTYNFVRQGDKIIVNIQTDIDFRFLSVPLYKFQHEAREVWRDDRLLRLVSSTNNNGETVALDVRADGDVLKVGGQAGQAEIDALAVPASLWNPGVVMRGTLVDPVSGKVMTTTAADKGVETLTVAGRTIEARRYTLSGDYRRDVWYDSRSGALVRVLFEGSDGSEIEYVRRQIGVGSLSSSTGLRPLIPTGGGSTVVE